MASIETMEKASSVLVVSKSDTLTVSITEYQNLVACRVLLDIIIEAMNEDGFVGGTIMNAIKPIREIYI